MRKSLLLFTALITIAFSVSGCGGKLRYEKPAGHPSTCSCIDCSLALK